MVSIPHLYVLTVRSARLNGTYHLNFGMLARHQYPTMFRTNTKSCQFSGIRHIYFMFIIIG